MVKYVKPNRKLEDEIYQAASRAFGVTPDKFYVEDYDWYPGVADYYAVGYMLVGEDANRFCDYINSFTDYGEIPEYFDVEGLKKSIARTTSNVDNKVQEMLNNPHKYIEELKRFVDFEQIGRDNIFDRLSDDEFAFVNGGFIRRTGYAGEE
jgi:hypothetical protein